MRLPFPVLALAVLSTFFAHAGIAAAASAPQLWTCGMHPQIIKTEPGNCPICGMQLVPVRANAATAERKIKYYQSTMKPGEVSPTPAKDSMGMDMVPVYENGATFGEIQIDAATVQRMNVKTAVVTRGPLRREVRTVGSVTYDEHGLRDITTKYEGWIEKLYVDTTWAHVRAGEPLFEIYSPDLYNAELQYLVARRGEGDEGGPLTRSALARLQLLDVPPSFVEALAKSGKAERTFVYRAPSDGVVIEKTAVAGQMVKAGERIYRLADLSSVWVLAQVYEQDLPFVRAGQPAAVKLSYGSNQTFAGKVDLLLPQVEEQTRAATARIVLPNPDLALRPGMYVDVRFESELSPSAVLVPDLAVVRSGERNTVFVVRGEGTFGPREVQLGARASDDMYEVLSGLQAGDRVVTSGQFLLDSESQLREAIQKMVPNSAKATEGKPAQGRDGPLGAPGSEGRAGTPLPAEARNGVRALPQDDLTALAFASADAAAALAADDLAGYEKQREVINAALAREPAAGLGEAGPRSPTAATTSALPRPLPLAADLESARKTFEPFSTEVADLARSAHLQHTAGLHVFQCPMAPNTGQARWLQRASGTKNPFYGTKMPDCGEELK